MKLRATKRARNEDDLVPLINVVFLLLIFFLIAGTLMPTPAVQVRYVEAEGAPEPVIPPGALFVDRDGGVFLDGQPVAPDGLGAAAASLDRDDGKVPLVIDRDLPMRDLAPVLDGLGEAGAGIVEIVTIRGGRS